MLDPESYLSDILIFYGRFYAPHIVLLATLSAITIYRRELSSNHVYAEVEGEDDDRVGETKKKQEEEGYNDQKADEVLDRAGLFCSGTSLLPLILSILNLFHLQQQQQEQQQQQSDSKPDNGNDDSNLVSSLLPLKHNVSAGDLLELAGNFYCCEPVASLILQKPMHIPISRAKRLENHHISSPKPTPKKESRFDDLLGLPADAWIHVISFLKPRDVTSFACTSRHCRDWVEQGETSQLVWKTLWQRDYGWVLQHWNIGVKAAARTRAYDPTTKQREEETQANHTAATDFLPHFSKQAYLWFQLCFVDYVLAGCNKVDQCFVGISGHIYDLSLFLLSHPGSPETVMVHAGQDASDFFLRIGHSKGARKLARSMCVLVDTARLGGEQYRGQVGVRPTSLTCLVSSSSSKGMDDMEEVASPRSPPPPSPASPPDENVMTRHHHPACSTLKSVKANFEEQQRRHQSMCIRQCSKISTLTQPKVYYDPVAARWKAWYMDQNMENVFIESLG